MLTITTPTGQIGARVLERVLGREPVRVIVRDPSRLPAHVRERVEIVQGSHRDPATATKAFTGADRAFWLVPPDPRATGVEEYYRSFARAAAEAIGQGDVQQVVAVSTLSRGVRRAGHLSAAITADEEIMSTGVRYRALCPPFFMENLLAQLDAIRTRGTFVMTEPPDRPIPTVATRDIAAVAARLLLDDSWEGQGTHPVVGPDHLSMDAMAQIMTDVLERPVRYQQVTEADYKASLVRHGMSDAWAQGIVDMLNAPSQPTYYEPRTHKPTPTTFHQWCETTLKPLG